jgi:hypothetical protein
LGEKSTTKDKEKWVTDRLKKKGKKERVTRIEPKHYDVRSISIDRIL